MRCSFGCVGRCGSNRNRIFFTPYVIQKEDSGLEVDIIREAFKAEGHTAVFVYLPPLRFPTAFSEGRIDAVASNDNYDLESLSGRRVFSSSPTVVYQNYAISLKKDGLRIDSVEDLSDKSIIAFQNSMYYLGDEYARMAIRNPEYKELSNQALQVRMLYSGRADVVVTDGMIFHYWLNQVRETDMALPLDLDQAVVFSPIFPSAPRCVSFGSSMMRDTFERGLEAIKANGIYDDLVERFNCMVGK